MATKRKPVALVAADEDYLAPDSEDFELYDFMNEVGAQIARVYVYRLPATGNPKYLGLVAIEALRAPGGAEEWLFQNHGAGDYSLKFRGSDGRWKLQKNLSIGERNPAGGAPAARENGGGRADELEKELAIMRQRSHEVLIAMIQKPAAPGGDPAAMLTAMVGAITALRAPAAPLEAAPNGAPDWLGKVRDIVDLARDLAPRPRGDEENGAADWPTVIRDVGVKVAEAMVVNARQPAAAPGAAPLALPPAAQSGADLMTQNLRTALLYLKTKAIVGKPPENYVAQILDNDDEPQWRALIEALEQGATFEHLLQFDPEIAANPALAPWFRLLYDQLHKEIFDPPAMDTGRPNGNADNPSPDAGIGAPRPDRPSGKKTGGRLGKSASD